VEETEKLLKQNLWQMYIGRYLQKVWLHTSLR